MFEDSPKEMAERIRRSTVYAAAKICLQLFKSPSMYPEQIKKLKLMIYEKSGTWKELSDAISVIVMIQTQMMSICM